MSIRNEIRPLEPTRGRAVQGIKSRLDAALARPQCLVFGLPPTQPMFQPSEPAHAWDVRKYAWQWRAGNVAAPLMIHTHGARPRHRITGITIALDLLPIYIARRYAAAEGFGATRGRGARCDLLVGIRIFQGGVEIAKSEAKASVDYTPTNRLSASHTLRTLGFQHTEVDTFFGFKFGVDLAYAEGTFDPVRDLETEVFRFRHSVALPTHDETRPLEFEITAKPHGAPDWIDGNSIPLWGGEYPAIDFCSLWATGLSIWGHP